MAAEIDQDLWKGVKDILQTLNDSEKRAAIKQLRSLIDRELINIELPDAALQCCNCGCSEFVRNGHTAAGTQRYKCKSYGLTQSFSSTGNILGLTKLNLETWYGFAECFVNCYTCEQVVSKLGVTLETAWYCRVRLMKAV